MRSRVPQVSKFVDRLGPVLSVSLLLLVPVAVVAQTTGNIVGTATDANGRGLQGVTVEATSAALQGARVAVTSATGEYRFPIVPPGSYKVKASLAGFTTVEKAATVQLDSTATVDMRLQITQKEEVVVTGEAPVIDQASTITGSNYSAKVLSKLPLDRNFASVVQLQPGVQPDTGDRQGRGMAFSIYGSTSAENQYVIDGINTNQVNRGVQGKVINNEFIQEVEVKTSGYQAEYGGATGGVINVITKSGGNEFHGDVFGNYGPESLRADQFHDGAKDSFNLVLANVLASDYGVDLGGFLWKDRVWFFGAYDRGQGHQDRVASSHVIPPPPSGPNGVPYREASVYNLFSGKMTLNIAQGSTLVGSYFRDPEHRDGAIFTPVDNNINRFEGRRDIGAEDWAVQFNQLFGSFGVFAAQYSQHHDRFNFKPISPDLAVMIDRTHAEDFPNFPTTGGFGRVNGYLNNNTGNRDQIDGSFTAFFGSNELKVGGQWMKNVTRAVDYLTGGQRVRARLCSTSSGSVNYCPPGEGVDFINTRGEHKRVYFDHGFFADQIGSFNQIPKVISEPPSKAYSFFLQDTFRITPRLTLNAGIRYEAQQVQNAEGLTAIDLKNEWQPRAGLVWDWKGDGSSKAYASFGRFYYILPNDLNVRNYGSQFIATTWNYSTTSTQPGGPGTGPPNRKTLWQGATAEPTAPNIKGQYQDEYALGIEQAITPTLVIGLKGMYRHWGRAIEDRCDLDYRDPINGGSTCGITNPGGNTLWSAAGGFGWCDGAGSAFVSPTAGECSLDNPAIGPAPSIPAATRDFWGGELTVRQTFTKNLWAQFSYVYSTLRGNYDGAVRVASGQTDPGINADYDYPLFSRNADGRLFLDRPHQLRLDAVYTSPFGLSAALGAYYRSGPPVSRYGWFNDFYPDLLHLVPRGTDTAVSGGRLPGQYEANVSLSYGIQAGPVTITPAIYVFNMLNRQGVTSVNENFNPDGTFCLNAGGCTNQTINPDTGLPDMTSRNFARTGKIAYGQPLPQEDWAKPSNRQDPRSIRFGLKVTF
ncbi:MAG: TonB-dependent receptor [Thermoanaerobaculia bacterium]